MKIHKTLLLIGAMTLMQATQAQKTLYDANAQVREVGSFTGVTVSGAIDLYISMGDADVVAVSAKDAELIPQIITEVKNGILNIRFEGRGIMNWGAKQMKAYVSVRSLSKLKASGSCDIQTDGALKSNDLIIELSGASDFKGEVDVQNLRLEGSGSSDFHIAGKAVNARIDMSGASDLKGYELAIDNCDATASGASDIKITVQKEFVAQASGASNINYKGDPTVKDVRSSGSSDIKKVGGKKGTA